MAEPHLFLSGRLNRREWLVDIFTKIKMKLVSFLEKIDIGLTTLYSNRVRHPTTSNGKQMYWRSVVPLKQGGCVWEVNWKR